MKTKIRDNKITFKHDGKVIKKFKRGVRYWGNAQREDKELALFQPEMAALRLLEGDWKVPYADVVEVALKHLANLEYDGFIDDYTITFMGESFTELRYNIAGVKSGLTIRKYVGGTSVRRILMDYLLVEEALRVTGNKNWEQLDHNVFLVKYNDKETWLLAGDRVLSVVHDVGGGESRTYMIGSEDQGLHLGKTPAEALLAFELYRARTVRQRQQEVVYALLKYLCKGKDIAVSKSDNGNHASYLIKFPYCRRAIIVADGFSSGSTPDVSIHLRGVFSSESSIVRIIEAIRESE